MNLVPCSVDGVRGQEKPSTLFWAWNRTDGSRVAFKQRLCIAHFAERIVPLQVACEQETATCPNCGIDTAQDMDPVYCTGYLPGAGRFDLQMPMCGACASVLRGLAQEGAVALEDRQVGAATPAPTQPSSDAVWAALGRR